MTTPLISKPGITSASALSIPTTWSPSWFRGVINNYLTGGDVRNATSPTGTIKIGGTIASPYGTIDLNTGSNITFTGNITITPASGVGLTVNAASGSSGSVFNGSANSSAITINGSVSNPGAVGTGSGALIYGPGGGEFVSLGGSATLSSYIGLYSGNPGTGSNVGFIGYGTGILTGGANTDLIIRAANTMKLAAGGNHLNVTLTSTTFGALGAAGAAQSTGWGTPTGASIVTNFPGATATLVQCSNTIAELITLLKGWGFLAT